MKFKQLEQPLTISQNIYIDLEVSIPGNITCEKLEAILLDMAALALKLYKSLAARLFSIAAKKAGEMTEFITSPYLVDCQVSNVT